MLVLSRKVNEKILIGDNIRITVVTIKGNLVRIGIEAPPSFYVYRDELVVNSAQAFGWGAVGDAADWFPG